MTKAFCQHNLGYKKVKKNKKYQESSPYSEFVTEMLILRSKRSQMFFEIGVLKNFAKLEPLFNKDTGFLLQNTYGGCFWIFTVANTFQLNLVFIVDNRTSFCSGFLWKNELKSLWDSNTYVFLLNLRSFWECLIWSLRTTAIETSSFTWLVLLNNLNFWLKLVHLHLQFRLPILPSLLLMPL